MPNPIMRYRYVAVVVYQAIVGLSLSLLWAVHAAAYDGTVTFTPTNADGYRLYVNDCEPTGPVGAPIAEITSGERVTALIAQDGTYEVCVRAYNAAGETPDPGSVQRLEVQSLPAPISDLNVEIHCDTCVVTPLNTVSFRWEAPTEMEDGTPIEYDITYRVYRQQGDEWVEVGHTANTQIQLQTGKGRYVATAEGGKIESAYSNEVIVH